MNTRTSFALLAVLAAVGTMTVSAYAQTLPGCPDCTVDDFRQEANTQLLSEIPLSIWTDSEEYNQSDIITVTGKVSNPDSVTPILLRVTSPLNSVIDIKQINPADIGDGGSFEVQFVTSNWKYDGIYIIQTNYGGSSDNLRIGLTGGIAYEPRFATPQDATCNSNELAASGQCIPYTISGGIVTSAFIDVNQISLIINIESDEGGILTINPAKSVQDGIFLVIVDGEEDESAIIDTDANMVTIMFPPGAEQVEVFSTFVIPEFGAIAAIILAVAVIAVIATSRSRLSIMPRY